ncbi:nitrogenase component I subunit alpha [bacterium]|nr:nitrogenase component I subunit alpha [bacterium]
MEKVNLPDAAKIKDELLKVYPTKVARKRSKHITVISPEKEGDTIQANVRTVPGIITQRGCCYAGCRGVVLGPTRDIVQIIHGPVGCAYYSWLTRRNQTRPKSADAPNYMTYCFTTDMQEEQIIFGGEKKLKQAIQEAYDLLHPKAIGIFATCPVGLIGDDVHQVAREMSRELGINIFGFSCEGYKGVSQSAGHHIANNQLFKHVVGLDDEPIAGKYKINLLGEYNIGGDGFLLEEMFVQCGFTQVSTFSGNSSYNDFCKSHNADLNLVMCYRSINYMAEMMQTKFGIPWLKINFIGAKATADSLRKIAGYFGDAKLIDTVEKYIAQEMPEIEKVQAELRPRLEGKLALIFVGGSRAHHYQELFKEIGMKVVGAGYEFAHRDDYEGCKVLDGLEVDADSRNIEELKVEKDSTRFQARLSAEKKQKLEKGGIQLNHYEGMIPSMEKNTLSIDDISQFEQEKLLELYKPAIFCAGIKEKYGVQKNGIPCKQLHSYDSGGPYAGFRGAINFYREIDRIINTRIWKLIDAPWKEEEQLRADFATT